MSCERPKKLDLERYLAGELEADKSAELESHLEHCNICSGMLDQLKEAQNSFLREFPYQTFADSVKQPEESTWMQKLSEWLFQPVLVPVYASVLIVFLLVPVWIMRDDEQSEHLTEVSYKGNSKISFLYRRAGIIQEGNADAVFFEGDEIQIKYLSAGFSFLSLFSIDAKGTVSFYDSNPGSRFCSEKIMPGRKSIFPGSIILDDSPGGELILALFSSEPVQRKHVKRKLAKIISGPDGNLTLIRKTILSRQLFPKSEMVPLLIKKAGKKG